ncbi:flavin reductase [Acuticoccus sediminis]|uniref:Flavin reductase n=1 Tax=Acuticoccus sediminis TaxID=2184697 RepID=A0A8B2NRA8_9HYPH|nr:flavin reductase family protein [Acuticoccus sediminis]RAH99551.1 flavin reductase [Acuticoccus sediminis]
MSVSASRAAPASLNSHHSIRLKPPSRRPAADTAFRSAMSSMASTVGIVTAAVDAERVGRTVTSAISLSVQPPAILVSIDVTSRLAEFIIRADGFSYAVLASDQERLGDAFAGGLSSNRRFELGRWEQWGSGHPRLKGAVTVLDCELIGTMTTTTHVLFVGAVADANTTTERAPLLWHNRSYRHLDGDTANTLTGASAGWGGMES